MPVIALVSTLAVYVVLAVLLLSLNIFSLWRWWVKAGAIIVTCACFVIAYFAITSMIGWPSNASLPQRFSVVATRIVEPDRTRGLPGHVYLWVEELNEHAVPVTPPRGYELPYTPKLADDADTAQKKINSGQQVMGEARKGQGEAAGTTSRQTGTPGRRSGRKAGKTGEGSQPSGETTAAETIGEAQIVVFSDMPPVDLPDKADEPLSAE